MKLNLRFKSNVDLKKIVWSRPDSRIAPFCSFCLTHIPEDDVPLMIWNPEGAAAHFCDECISYLVESVPG